MNDAEFILTRALGVRRTLIREGYLTIRRMGYRVTRERMSRGWLMTIHALAHRDDCSTCLAAWRADMRDADSQLLCAFPHHDWTNTDD